MADDKNRVLSVPPPPRVTGNQQENMLGLMSWAQGVFNSLEKSNTYVKTAELYEGTDFDPTELPDPGSTTLRQAQETANNAYTLAATNRDRVITGVVRVSGTSRTGTYTFDEPLPDDNYIVLVTAAEFHPNPPSGETGPTYLSMFPTFQQRFTDRFEITINNAPGTYTQWDAVLGEVVTKDNWVEFVFLLWRKG